MVSRYETEYASQLSNLLKDYPMKWGDSAQETVIGVGSLSKKPVHPYREHINIFIQPKMRRQGIGKSLFQELLCLAESLKWQAAISSKNGIARSFLENRGDPFAFALLNAFKYDKSKSWDTYIYG